MESHKEEEYYVASCGRKYKYTYEGKIHGITGPMRSGKSDELIRQLKRHSAAPVKVVALKPRRDTRQKLISSRHGTTYPAICFDKIMDPEFISDILKENYYIIGIDEAQFAPDAAEFCTLMANLGKKIYVSFLSGNFFQRIFVGTEKLIPELDTVTRLNGVCSDCPYNNGDTVDAPFTILISEDADLRLSSDILVGDSIYKTVCRKCRKRYSTQCYWENK